MPNARRLAQPSFTPAETQAAVAALRLISGRKWASRMLIGHLGAIVLFVTIASSSYQRLALLGWATMTVTTTLTLFLSLHHRRAGVPTAAVFARFAFGAAVMQGVAWGSLIFIDLDAAGTAMVRWYVMASLLAVTAGTLAGLEGSSKMGQLLLGSMWLTAACGFVATGDALLSLAAWIFLPAVTWVFHERHGVIERLINLQVASGQRARIAEWEADHDSLTAILNRSGLRSWFASCPPTNSHALFIDLDHFKRVNDRYGHVIGDLVLKEAAERVDALIGGRGIVARLGGDEFLAVIPATTRASIRTLCEEMVTDIEVPILLDGIDPIMISASIGMADIHESAFDFQVAVQESDLAMYQAKKSGRRGVEFFSPAMRAQQLDRQELEADFREAVSRSEIEAWGQPIVHLLTGEVSHVELLARWRRADGSIVPPDVFLPIAEEIGVMGDLTDLMLNHAGRALELFGDHQWFRHAGVAVNISGFEFDHRDVAAAVQDAIRRFSIPTGKLVIELTETMGFDPARAAAVFGRLARLGVEMAIDDFGTSTSSVTGLLEAHAAIVKIDRSLVSGISGDDRRRHAIVAALQQLGDGMGFTVVAECVEQVAEVECLTRAGVRYGQGFLFVEPKPLPELMSPTTERAVAEFTRHLQAVATGPY